MIDLMHSKSQVRFSQADDFLSLLPSISRYASRAFRFLDVEARDEAVQEVVAKSFSAYRRLLERGREDTIAAAPLEVVQSRVINAEVLRGMDCNAARSLALIEKRLPKFLHSLGRDFAGVPGSRVYVALQTGELSYRSWCFRKPLA